ncbi:hypothetical protein [Lederbergia citrea]|uniref:hypothetical protein n=1 Tax=Lederbergia citrea TaxID=2833581 RepID=UPI001BC9FFEA|nr:hypothetical protein [Lederbergia citrea]MBS4178638.1 hypothetical protein [Lederbergia citrea]
MGKAKSISPYMLLGIGVAGASYLSSKDNRDKVKEVFYSIKDKVMDFWCEQNPSACDDLIEKAGNPDPHDLEDTRMVGEGAMYSVEFYNKEEQQE